MPLHKTKPIFTMLRKATPILTVLAITFGMNAFAQEVKQIANIDGSEKPAYINLLEGKAVSQYGDWSIGFHKTTILINSGSGSKQDSAQLVTTSFDQLTTAPRSGYKADGDQKAIPQGSGNGWYLYDTQDHSINPIPDRTIVVKTSNGTYVKIQVVSYYRDQKVSEPTGFYTIRYAMLP